MHSPLRDHSSAPRFARLLSEPARPERIAQLPNAYWLVVATVAIGAFMGQLDASIVSLALPSLHVAFHASIGAVEWVALAYLLTLVTAVVAVGRIADMVGRKLLYTYGFGVFIIGSALSGLAPSLGFLVAARILQAIGAAMLQSNSVALIVQAMPPEKLGRGIGIQGAAQAVGLAIGPMVGGLLIAAGGWRLVFFISVPAGIFGMILGWFLLPRSRQLGPRGPFDLLGFILFLPAVALPMAALSFGDDLGWRSLPILGSFAGGIVFTALFLMRERRAAFPMIHFSLFRSVSFAAGVASGLLSYLVLFGVLFIVPFYLEAKRGLSTATAGLVLTALPVAIGLAAPVAGRLTDRIGARWVTLGGMLIAASGLGLLAAVRQPEVILLAELGWIGIGLGAFTPANNAAIMATAPPQQVGLAGGLLNMTRGLGTSLGIALTGVVFTVFSNGAARAGTVVAQSDLAHGLVAAVLFLMSMAIVAGIIAAIRRTPRIVTRRV